MTVRSLARHYSRPLRAALVCSAAAMIVSLGGGAAALADDDHDRDHDRGGSYRDRDDRHDRDRGRDRWDDHDRGRDRRYYDQRDWRYRYRDDYRDRGHGNYDQDRGYRDHRDYRYGRSYRGGHYDRGFVVPRHIYRDHYGAYDRYYRGTVFYGPHRHHHRVYLFPVIVDGYVDYQPYAYCGEAYYPGQYGYDGARGHFGLHWSF